MGELNIILTGFMGTGKTTVGKLLAEELGYRFIDTDELIVSRNKITIEEIFREKGETEFRRIESEISCELAGKKRLVISTGGSLMLNPENAKALEKTGKVFCLTATPDEIIKRVSNDQGAERPLLKVEDPVQQVFNLLEERRKGYGRFIQIETTEKTPAEIVQRIINNRG